MDYIKEYKSFVNSHYLSEGLKITAGLTLPSVLLGYFHDLSAGIIVSLGACCVIFVDNAGPIRDRRNAMVVCNLVIFVVSLLTGLVHTSSLWLSLFILSVCFFFSMIAVYGNRAGSIGLAAMFVMVLNIRSNPHGWQAVINACYVLSGGLWYTLLSLLLYSFRPFKLAQQALGDCLQATAAYMHIKASFYAKQDNYQKNYQLLLDQQVTVHEKQDLVRELLFKSRDIVKETTHTGRVLVMIFLDAVDLFELVMSSHQDYVSLHRLFDDSDILERFREVIDMLADELEDIGIAVKSGKAITASPAMDKRIEELKTYFNDFRDSHRTSTNIEEFLSLRHILDSLEDIADRMHILQTYTSYDREITKQQRQQVELEQFVSPQDKRIDPKLLWENVSLHSNIFRHALRVSLATTTGYIVSQFLAVGHSYWILLTIIVILKPAYSLTKKRNYDRLLGTLAGAAIGLVILYLVKDRYVLFTCMILLMIGAYSFMRSRYLVFVILMTPYILLLFYLLNATDFATVIRDRVIDTVIGSAIAFLANSFIVPAWEHERFTDYLLNIVEANRSYFLDVANAFVGKQVTVHQFKLSRKAAFVALANLLDGFNRVLSEPRRKQKNLPVLHSLVVTQHMLTSHIATLASYVDTLAPRYQSEEFGPVIEAIRSKMNNAQAALEARPPDTESSTGKEGLRALNNRVNRLVDQRRQELDQGIGESEVKKKLSGIKAVADQFNFISKIATDAEKLCHAL
jgi:uncharacterized membrane protein (TIGR01666 family)